MKILVHKRALVPVKVISFGGEEIQLDSSSCTAALWELAGRFPNELIGWCEESFVEHLELEKWEEIFHHDLIMASYAVETTFLPERIGYVEQLPFANLNREVLYGTWRMSRDVGGIQAKVLNRFKPLMGKIENFEYLLNSVAKLGQQNSLFCYSAPGLVKHRHSENISYTASKQQLFSFVYQHYNSVWLVVLIWCLYKYENELSLNSFLRGFKKQKYFQKKVDLSKITISPGTKLKLLNTIDVIIPTMGRPDHLYNVLKDLAEQTRLPEKVVIIEQNSNTASISALDFLKNEQWPFEIIHHFIHQTGACNARNIGLKEVASEWVFFADDDIRIKPDTIDKALQETRKYKIDALNMNCKQEGEKTVFDKVRQWGSFGSGTSIVRASFAKNCSFSLIYEHGYGEDMDFGMQLRNLGCDIVYHPELVLHHLKASVGGFREKHAMEWEIGNPRPKPSPTIMAFAKKYFSSQQMLGYKMKMFLQNYRSQKEKNPFIYYSNMNKKWSSSEFWAEQLLRNEQRRASDNIEEFKSIN